MPVLNVTPIRKYLSHVHPLLVKFHCSVMFSMLIDNDYDVMSTFGPVSNREMYYGKSNTWILK